MKGKKSEPEEKPIETRQLDMVATAIANATISAVKAAAVWMPDKITRYKEQRLLETVIAKLNNSY